MTKSRWYCHEAVPGHIFQTRWARSQKGLPDFRKFYSNSAYGEGWACMRSAGSQLGVYRIPTPFGTAGERNAFVAARLVIDTGITPWGWTGEQAQEYFRAPRSDAGPVRS